ncbi:LOW QUALITY PROTEIN: uridine phosphorylase 2 [Balearica regulorum gibbericeps]|uniref:LOW QUALITY PROTEIN: uridine phosphorylase 2 n=1 Tax=Balearica regulorum gibbericeps TaxID=100784 RepID=UPI003F604B6D
MMAFAQLVPKEQGLAGDGEDLTDICVGTDRYATYQASALHRRIEAGSVAITDTAVDDSFEPQLEQVVLDDTVVRSTKLDKDLTEELRACSRKIPDFPTLVSRMTCTRVFYKGKTIFGCPPSTQA